MYEHMTYEAIMARALARVPDDKDKRQGSTIWDALAPACAELAQAYIEMDHILKITHAKTAAAGRHSEWLDKRCGEMGVYRKPATSAVRLGLFYMGSSRTRLPFDVPIGSRYSIETLNYVVTEKIETGQFKLLCEETGIVGNQLFGRLIPINTVNGLSYAELAEVLIPGEEEETDEALYIRYEKAVNEQPFGGNIADYKRKVNAMEGVGDCKVFPVRRGGGMVDVTLIASDLSPPSSALIADVQEKLDPEPYHQMGMGQAPIGHWVKVAGVEGVEITVASNILLKNGVSIGQVEEDIQNSIRDYFTELAEIWADEEKLITRVSQIENRILNVKGVLDINATTLNGTASNIVLTEEQIPVLREVVLYA